MLPSQSLKIKEGAADAQGVLFLYSLDQNRCLVPHLKDSIHICLSPERQECGMIFDYTFKGLNYPQNASQNTNRLGMIVPYFTHLLTLTILICRLCEY